MSFIETFNWIRKHLLMLLIGKYSYGRKIMLKLIVFPLNSRHLSLLVTICIIRVNIVVNIATSVDINIILLEMFFGVCNFTTSFSSNTALHTSFQIFWLSKFIEQKHFRFLRSYSCILIISRIFNYAITKN